MRALPPAPLTVSVEIASPTRLVNRKVRRLALRHLAFGTGKRRADQAAVHGTLVVRRGGQRFGVGLSGVFGSRTPTGFCRFRRLGSSFRPLLGAASLVQRPRPQRALP